LQLVAVEIAENNLLIYYNKVMNFQDLQILFVELVNRLSKFYPLPIALERALNLCFVLGDQAVRPACLWYTDIDYAKSVKILEQINSDDVSFTVGGGKIEMEDEEVNFPHTFIFRNDNQKALELIRRPNFHENMFENHKDLGEALGYLCAGDPPDAQYHARFAGRILDRVQLEFTVLEQMCEDRHRDQFQQLAQKMQDFCDHLQSGIQIHLFTTDIRN